jgi:TP901 family phage tail tape measure protein
VPVTVSELQVRVSADTSPAEKELDTLGSKVGGLGSTLAGIGAGAAVAGIAALGAAFVGSVGAASSFATELSAISAVSGATADEMSGLSGLALQLGKDTSFSASEAAKGIEELVKAGVSIPDIMGGAASASLSLAAAGAVSVGDAAAIAATAMNTFSLKGSDLAHVADVIAGAANASAIDVNDYKFSLSRR